MAIKCINVELGSWDGRTDRQTDRQTDGQTDRWMDESLNALYRRR